jgi:iron-sulfur cluster assembly accessory protein
MPTAPDSSQSASHGADQPDLRVTDKALEMVRAAQQREGSNATGLRIGVIGGGCSGLQYHMTFEIEPQANDAIFEIEGVKIFIDRDSREHLAGVTVDYVTGLHGAGFRFENPNASRTCGCGSSFATDA